MIIILLYIGSFILENRSGDLESMNTGLEELYFEKRKNQDAPKFDQVGSAHEGYQYSVERILFIMVDYIEKIPDRNYRFSVLSKGNPNNYTFVDWTFVQINNLLIGARFYIKYRVPSTGQIEEKTIYFGSELNRAQVSLMISELNVNLHLTRHSSW
jgi:hypothetical protein